MKKILSLIMMCGALSACAPKEIYKSKIDYSTNQVDTSEVEEYYVNGKHDEYYTDKYWIYGDYPDIGRYGEYYTYEKEFKKDEFFQKTEIKSLSTVTKFDFFDIVDNNETLTNVYYKDNETYKIEELEYTFEGSTTVEGNEAYYYKLEKYYLVDLVDKDSIDMFRLYYPYNYDIYILKVTYTMTFNKKLKSNKSNAAKLISTNYSTETIRLSTKSYSIDMK